MNFPETYQGPHIANIDICIPLKSGGSKWDNNELRYCLRSIEKFWIGEVPPIYLLTTSELPWIDFTKIKIIPCVSYIDAVKEACNRFQTYCWFNDDIFLIKDTGLNDLVIARYMKEMKPFVEIKGNKWIKKLCNVRDNISNLGYSPIFNFSTHTPYLFNGNLMKHIVNKFGVDYKTPLETYYYNISRDWHPAKKCDDKLTLNNGKSLPCDLSPYKFVNVFDGGLTEEIKNWLAETFPEKSSYEL